MSPTAHAVLFPALQNVFLPSIVILRVARAKIGRKNHINGHGLCRNESPALAGAAIEENEERGLRQSRRSTYRHSFQIFSLL